MDFLFILIYARFAYVAFRRHVSRTQFVIASDGDAECDPNVCLNACFFERMVECMLERIFVRFFCLLFRRKVDMCLKKGPGCCLGGP